MADDSDPISGISMGRFKIVIGNIKSGMELG